MHDHHHHCHDPAPPMPHHHHGHCPPAHHCHDPCPPPCPPPAFGPPDFWNNLAPFPGPPSWGSSSGAPCTVRVKTPPVGACDAAAPLLEPRPHGDCDGAAAPSRTDQIVSLIIWAFIAAWIIYWFGFH